VTTPNVPVFLVEPQADPRQPEKVPCERVARHAA
jgi:hypothetical protein